MEQIEDSAIPATAAPQPVVKPEPTVEALVELRDQLTPIQWEARLAKAQRALWVVHQVRELRRQHGRTLSWRACLRQVDPLVSWSRYLHWRRRLSSEEGQEWERLLDRRLPPRPAAIAPEVLNAATILRRANPSISVESAQAHLVAQFDQRGNVSASALRRTWRMAGLNQQPPGGPDHFEVVKHFQWWCRTCVDRSSKPGDWCIPEPGQGGPGRWWCNRRRAEGGYTRTTDPGKK